MTMPNEWPVLLACGFGVVAIILIFVVGHIVAQDPPPDETYRDVGPPDPPEAWDPLFDGPEIGKRCVVGALEHGMRFFEPRRRWREWLVLDREVVMGPPRPDAVPSENWPRPVGRECVDLASGEVKTIWWHQEVIRTR